jgi:hypothetical protein
MAINFNPKIVTDGLIFYVDAMNLRSTSNPSMWVDISGSGTVLTRNGSPSLTTLEGTSCYRFLSTGQSFTGTLLGTQPTTDCTIETWIYPEAEVVTGDRGTLLLLSGSSSIYMSWNKSTLRQSNYWYSHPYEGYWETGAAVSRNTWNNFTAVWNYSAGAIYQFTNNVKTTGSTTQGNAPTGNSINIGQESSDRQFAGGIALVRVYNRALTDSEVAQNFNANRGRFRL